jgi:hypothetical protein
LTLMTCAARKRRPSNRYPCEILLRIKCLNLMAFFIFFLI